ncbi:RagB/SusD family nutrient uptake outer membrane protein [Flavivirga eckloniae]|uniref:RagB/SusD family nutrient uptake outer membrane protein n=1 Tax=Flavivirga eckloniae TaxID=1803846 RepID=A0A2K9PSY8_9FLAO|nr:RagB/SusD family nutrient uptake outer membrane protein [Flavivirga eckloniae]AUP80176.1 hypothetical protein C1H87_16255 [Flavivirga eckloniae]
MKNIKLIIVSILCLCFSQSCTDYLDVTPENSVTFENFFNTDEELYTFVNSIRLDMKFHAFSPNQSKWYSRGILFDDASSLGLEEVGISPNSLLNYRVITHWEELYRIIAGGHVLLRHTDDANITEERKDFYNGLGNFYVAYGYLKLSQLWGEAPLVKFDGDVGPKKKGTFEEVIDFCIENAEKAVQLLPTINALKDGNGDSVQSRDLPSKEAALSVLTHAYAWKGSLEDKPEFYEKAIQSATAIIDSPNVTLAASPEDVVTSVIKGGNTTESIFEAALIPNETRFSNTYHTVDGFLAFPVGIEGEGDIKFNKFRINNSTVDAMYTNGDERKAAYFYDFEVQKAKDPSITGGYAYPYKFREGQISEESFGLSFDYLVSDAVFYRLADIILLRAECYAKMGNDGAAIQDLNTIRARAGADLYTASEGNVQYMVFKEREKELLWENNRYLDVVRNGYWATELIDDSFSLLSQQDVENGALFLFTPFKAFDNNPLMTQNIFWSGLL